MYAIEYRKWQNGDHRWPMLHEMSTAQFAKERDSKDLLKVTPAYAREWVKNGNPHCTPLYINHEGRVRYARPGI